jgi:glycosyltransferase involved in cell wall biosynthesis
VNKTLKISVAMCTCNGQGYLGEQLDSILGQTLLPDELIACDDASTDATLSILEAFKEKAPFPVTIFVNTQRVGVCRNFARAIERCSGDIIFLADQDDVWRSFKLATTMAAFESHPLCGYVFSNAELMDEQGKDIGRDLWTSIGFDQRLQARYSTGDQLSVMLRWFSLTYGMTMAFRAAYKHKLIPFECPAYATAHDAWISLVLTSIGAFGVALPSPLVRYRQHSAQHASAGKPLGFVELVKKKRSDMAQTYEAFAGVLTRLAIRLQDVDPNNQAVSRAKKELAERVTHLRARVRANSSHGFQRFKVVFREAVSGRYGRYSRSFKSIVKDLVSS